VRMTHPSGATTAAVNRSGVCSPICTCWYGRWGASRARSDRQGTPSVRLQPSPELAIACSAYDRQRGRCAEGAAHLQRAYVRIPWLNVGSPLPFASARAAPTCVSRVPGWHAPKHIHAALREHAKQQHRRCLARARHCRLGKHHIATGALRQSRHGRVLVSLRPTTTRVTTVRTLGIGGSSEAGGWECSRTHD